MKSILNELLNAIEAQVKSIKQDMEGLTTLKDQLLVSDNVSVHASGFDERPSTLPGITYGHALDKNLTNIIKRVS